MPRHLNIADARRGVFDSMPTTKQLKTFFDELGPSEADDIRGSKGAGRRLQPAIKLFSGKVVKGVPGVDTHVSIERAAGITSSESLDRVKTKGFFDKRAGKFIGRAKAFVKFGIGDSFQLFDPRTLQGKTFGPGFLGGLVAPEIFDMMVPGGLFPKNPVLNLPEA